MVTPPRISQLNTPLFTNQTQAHTAGLVTISNKISQKERKNVKLNQTLLRNGTNQPRTVTNKQLGLQLNTNESSLNTPHCVRVEIEYAIHIIYRENTRNTEYVLYVTYGSINVNQIITCTTCTRQVGLDDEQPSGKRQVADRSRICNSYHVRSITKQSRKIKTR